jgi:hypothetical protein
VFDRLKSLRLPGRLDAAAPGMLSQVGVASTVLVAVAAGRLEIY